MAAVRRRNVNALWLKNHSTALFNSGTSGVVKMACKTELSQQRLDVPFMPLFRILDTCNSAPDVFGSTVHMYKNTVVCELTISFGTHLSDGLGLKTLMCSIHIYQSQN